MARETRKPDPGFANQAVFTSWFGPDLKSATLIREMAMIHLSNETEALIRRLAAAQGISMEDAIKLAVEQSAREVGVVQKQRDPSPKAVAARKARIDEIVREMQKCLFSIRAPLVRSLMISTPYDRR